MNFSSIIIYDSFVLIHDNSCQEKNLFTPNKTIMRIKPLLPAALLALAAIAPQHLSATKLLDVKIVDKDYLMVHFRDGEVRYRDDATGPSAYLGHSFSPGDDTLKVFGPRLDAAIATRANGWTISSTNDKAFGQQVAEEAYRKSKPMNTDNTLTSELDHWIFLRLPQSMKQGCTYRISLPAGIEADEKEAEVKFDIWNSQSEAVHVNILGYQPTEPVKAADLYLWLGEGGQRDYKAFEGRKVYLYNVKTGKKKPVGKVGFWKEAAAFEQEANKKNMTGSDVWNIDFRESAPGRYRLVVEGVGCSMDFDISNNTCWMYKVENDIPIAHTDVFRMEISFFHRVTQHADAGFWLDRELEPFFHQQSATWTN